MFFTCSAGQEGFSFSFAYKNKDFDWIKKGALKGAFYICLAEKERLVSLIPVFLTESKCKSQFALRITFLICSVF
jgi:hypothetical protein